MAPNECYHILNRGNNKQIIFNDDGDRIRFLSLALLFQAPITIPNIRRTLFSVQHPMLNNIENDTIHQIIMNRYAELQCFVLMPNHFHLLVHEIKDGGISKYMQRVLNAYTKYFNIKYGVSGHLFQGSYKAVHINNNEQLLYLSTYIHRNPRELTNWKNKEHLYPWSSYQDYIGNNRWGKLLEQDLIRKQFKSTKEYQKFNDTSMAKTINFADSGLLLD